mmetsp:Transcript_86498/g.181128  ORF Transcript_86498/g.181128 Transcript_86498/m.181128 type:complete len:258 (-) Transcript_86498:461-1234(-)
MSLNWPTFKPKAARTTDAGILRFFAGSLSNHPRSPANSPPLNLVSQSESFLHLVVKALGPPMASSGNKRRSASSASSTLRVALGLPLSSWPVDPECRKRICRHRTFVRRLASNLAFFGAGASGSVQVKRTAAATRGGSAPARRASPSSEMHAARGLVAATWPLTKDRSLVPVIPGAVRTPLVTRSAPTWLSSRITQVVATSGPSEATSSSSMPPSPPSLPKTRQAAPPAAASTSRPPRSSTTAKFRPAWEPNSTARF